ncbi:TetR/AcrR family transcriptional regulator [Wukongibacter sp. M2B1]|uniref:TetR/AcrR family transcriptional regulator n=1 Tax=Wukongibacter sp. M2B1 TaxID=3088895 RepID=UPI003D78EE8C
MPKQTFFNLSEEKRQRIIDESIEEFAEYYYHKASISRIVKNAGIAKGSFYQYFEDKNDLFRYIIEKIGEKKVKYLGDIMANINKLNFFEVLREMYIAGIKFAIENPKFQQIGDDFLKDNDVQLKEEIFGDSIPKSNELFVALINQGIDKGDIDSSIDIGLTANIITNLSISIGEYFINEIKGTDYMEIMTLVDNMLYILKNGIKNKEG